jgi:hypothetical protein
MGSKQGFCCRFWNRRRARLLDFEDESEDDEHDLSEYHG